MEAQDNMDRLKALLPNLLQLVQDDEPEKIRWILDKLSEKDKYNILNRIWLQYKGDELLFHAASRLGDVDVMQVVRPNDPHVKTSCSNAYSALHIAAANGRRSATEWLLGFTATPYTFKPVDINSVRAADGNTPLHLAVLYRHKEVAHLLVQRGANLSVLNKDNMTPISYCQSSDMFDILMRSPYQYDILMRSPYQSGAAAGIAGLDLNLEIRTVDDTKRTVLHYAAVYCHDINLLTNLIYLSRPQDLTVQASDRPNYEGTFLHEAARVGNLEFLKATLNCLEGHTLKTLLCGHVEDDDQSLCHSPAMDALFSNQRAFFDEIVAAIQDSNFKVEINLYSILRRLREDPMIKSSSVQYDEGQPISILSNGNEPLKNADSAMESASWLPLQDILWKETEATVELFAGILPTYLALYASKTEVFFFLLERGIVTANQWDDMFRRTCLHWAVLHKRADIVVILMHTSERTNSMDSQLTHPMTKKDERKNNSINSSQQQQWRIAWSISPTIQDIDGRTAFQIAFEQENEELLEIMRKNSTFKSEEEKLFRDREVYVQGLNAILVVAALIAGVTFNGWLQLPSSDLGDLAMKTFYLSSNVSFFLAVMLMCVTIHALVPTPDKYIGAIRDQLRLTVVIVALLMVLCLVAATVAFAAAGFATLTAPAVTGGSKIRSPFTISTIVMGCVGCIPLILFIGHLWRCAPYVDEMLKVSRCGCWVTSDIMRSTFNGDIQLYKHKSRTELGRLHHRQLLHDYHRDSQRTSGFSATWKMKLRHKRLLAFPKSLCIQSVQTQ